MACGGRCAAAGATREAQAAQYKAAVARNNATAEAYKGSEKSQDVAIKGDYALARQRLRSPQAARRSAPARP